jgi:GAF domain-containing protein
MMHARRISAWVITVAFLAIAVVVSVVLINLNQIVDQGHQGETTLITIRGLAYKMSAIEWKLIGAKTVDAESEQTLAETRAEITQAFKQVLALDPQNPKLIAVKNSLDDYLKWLDEEIRLIKSGDLEEAIRVDSELVDPTFARLDASLNASQTFLIQRAEQIRAATNIGSIVFILAASLLIALLWFNNQQAWAKMLQATTEQESLAQATKHSEELAVYANALNRRNAQLQASARITRKLAEIHDIQTLMNAAVNLTADEFGYSHVGLYILDEGKRNAFLQAASSQTGIALIAQGYTTKMDKLNPLYWAVERNRPYFISNSADTAFVTDGNFPKTQSRIILPLIVRSVVIGLLDIHSEQHAAFEQDSVEILQALGSLIAISMDSVRLLNDTRGTASQLEALASQQSLEVWKKFTETRAPAYQYTPAGVRPLLSEFRSKNADEMQIPLTLRGQTIGAITLRRKNDSREWTKRERMLAEKIAIQAALALDNSRLVNDAQESALRDQMIAQVSGHIRETLDIDSILKTAAVELRKAFGLLEAEVRLDPSAETQESTPATSAVKTKQRSAGSNGQGKPNSDTQSRS